MSKQKSMNFYRDQVTSSSWKMLVHLVKTYRFILIGGWAVWLYTRQLKSKDIDIIVEFDQLGRLKEEFDFVKNERLHKYEARKGQVQIDIYVPHYSRLGLTWEIIKKHTGTLSGFSIPNAEILLILKQVAHEERKGSSKGQKDVLDIIGLLTLAEFNWDIYRKLVLETKGKFGYQLKTLIESKKDALELGINQHQYSWLKKRWLAEM